jgi:hypothetical protein
MCQPPESPTYLSLSRAICGIPVTVVTASEATAKIVVILVIFLVLVTSIAAGIAGEEPARHCNA